MTRKALLLASGLAIGVLSSLPGAFGQKDEEESPDLYRPDVVAQEIEGWTVLVDRSMLEGGEHAQDGKKALEMLRNHLQRISILVPEERLKELRTIQICIEWENPRLKSMQYHPNRKWLEENGFDPILHKKMHIPRARALLSRHHMLKHPAVVLHELAHAYHDQFLGFDNPEILEAYRNAMKKGIYEEVLLYTGRRVRHYATTNHKEYFAEMTEAYLYRNDFFPFVAAELREYDPQIYEIMEKIWGPIE